MQARKNAWRLLAVKMTFVQCTSVKYRAKVGLLVFWCLPSSSFTTQTYLVETFQNLNFRLSIQIKGQLWPLIKNAS